MKRFFAIMCVVVVSLSACRGASESDEESGGSALDENKNTVPQLGDRLDRLGRPEITNMLLTDPTKGILEYSAVKEAYNVADTFAIGDDLRKQVGTTLATSIARLDGYDKQTDFADDQVAKLAALLVDDYLLVDLTKPCDLDAVEAPAKAGFFEIELAQLTGKSSWATCGGHTPNEDSIDVQLTLYGKGFEPKDRVRDLVDSSTKKAPNVFPYLADPLPPPASPAPPAPPAPAPSQ